ncbi:helix-turn-helix domain-containing protein [Microbacterium hominis]|uniref:Helix-turn-helix domain-containing protein n=1 Tax=Microbacterium hominis TaxID=162426 RepID=A0A2K9D4W7_9MICO|nr:hypothetical protein [Microbacterium hominis]AUG28720.1 hypothetical protein CXR34_04040 [Microbacterium hominis]
MPDRMSGAEVAATRHLVGLTRVEFAEKLGVNPHTVKDLESGRLAPKTTGIYSDIAALRARHDAEASRLSTGAAEGIPIALPASPEPRGWYLALGARVLDRVPDAMLTWHEG